MGKRGPKPRPSSARRERPTGLRLRTDLRQRLEAAAKKKKRSLSREIENRLEASFGRDPKLANLFGGFKTCWLFQRMAQTIWLIERQTGKRWWEDRFTFNQMKSAIETGLEMVGPKGRAIVPKKMLQEAKLLPAAARIAPTKIGAQAMLIDLWSLSEVANQEAGITRPGYTVLGEQEDIHASAILGNDLVLDPMQALTSLQRKGSGRQRAGSTTSRENSKKIP